MYPLFTTLPTLSRLPIDTHGPQPGQKTTDNTTTTNGASTKQWLPADDPLQKKRIVKKLPPLAGQRHWGFIFSTTHLGTIAQQITNQIPDRAKLDRTNIFTLAVNEDEDLLCEISMSPRYVVLERLQRKGIGADKAGKGKASNPNADMHAPQSPSPAHHPLPPAALTGAGTDLPLHIAQNWE
ncbi:hypothetical protein R3P38DRAFT_2767736 [Favolaschia claudopus]|uniref:Uncharacterized protein n=1 Tax=Favolaschia claudopus TaxID=2862362 RepID=A0AAW0CS80_9AGAR